MYKRQYPKIIVIHFTYFGEANGTDYLAIDFTTTTSNPIGNSYILFPGGIDKPFTYDSLIIQGKTYRNIVYRKDDRNPNSSNKYGCFFNTAQGILRMETSDGDKWELLKVE